MQEDHCQWCKQSISEEYGLGCCDDCAEKLTLEFAIQDTLTEYAKLTHG